MSKWYTLCAVVAQHGVTDSFVRGPVDIKLAVIGLIKIVYFTSCQVAMVEKA